jgi:hypothetical protein
MMRRFSLMYSPVVATLPTHLRGIEIPAEAEGMKN